MSAEELGPLPHASYPGTISDFAAAGTAEVSLAVRAKLLREERHRLAAAAATHETAGKELHVHHPRHHHRPRSKLHAAHVAKSR